MFLFGSLKQQPVRPAAPSLGMASKRTSRARFSMEDVDKLVLRFVGRVPFQSGSKFILSL